MLTQSWREQIVFCMIGQCKNVLNQMKKDEIKGTNFTWMVINYKDKIKIPNARDNNDSMTCLARMSF